MRLVLSHVRTLPSFSSIEPLCGSASRALRSICRYKSRGLLRYPAVQNCVCAGALAIAFFSIQSIFNMPVPDNPLVLVLGGDDNYAVPMAVTLYSSLRHCTANLPVAVYILDGGISSDSKQRLEHIALRAAPRVEIHWIPVTPESVPHGMHSTPWLNDTAFLRLLIPDVLPDHCTRALYLDSDLVVQDDLMEIWRVPFDGAAILAVQDAGVPYVSDRRGIPSYGSMGLSATSPYFNSGVMMLNVPRWRTERIGQQVIDYLHAHTHKNHFGNQDGLNAVLAHDWKPLSALWNVPSFIQAPYWARNVRAWADSDFLREMRALRTCLSAAARIIHYAGPKKPWHWANPSPLQRIWYQSLWQSGWYTPAEATQSRLAFYTRWTAQRFVIDPVRRSTRPFRQRLADWIIESSRQSDPV